jgi:DNA invertase Pin-like site-specific DNA recombinase
MLGALAEFERELIRDRTKAGMAAARQRGVTLGRPRKLTAAQVREARARLARGEKSDAVAATYAVSTSTLRRAIANG